MKLDLIGTNLEAAAEAAAEAETAATVAGAEVWAPGSGGGPGTVTHWPRNQVVPAEAEAARLAVAETAIGTAACVTEAETAFGIIAAALGISGTTYLSIISAGIPA